MNLADRQKAVEATLARFKGKPFSWSGANCIRFARYHAVQMGHQLPPVPQFRTALGAKRALAKRGYGSVGKMLDRYFTRHRAPAFAMLGDLVALPADPELGLEAVCIADGQGNVWGWSEQNDSAEPVAILAIEADVMAAWRL